jgi:N-acylglucosamine-6-phosphate 2-epimerase
MAKAAVEGGAVAIRALTDEIPSIKATVGVPVIGLVKKKYGDSEIYITPTVSDADAVLASGADAMAIDGTSRPRPGGVTLKEIVDHVRRVSPKTELIADIDSLQNGLIAESLGFDYVSTTLCGYTRETADRAIPDFRLIGRLKANLKTARLIVEGGIWEVGQLKRVLKFDPYAVIIGTAVTRPGDITRRFNKVFTDRK